MMPLALKQNKTPLNHISHNTHLLVGTLEVTGPTQPWARRGAYSSPLELPLRVVVQIKRGRLTPFQPSKGQEQYDASKSPPSWTISWAREACASKGFWRNIMQSCAEPGKQDITRGYVSCFVTEIFYWNSLVWVYLHSGQSTWCCFDLYRHFSSERRCPDRMFSSSSH